MDDKVIENEIINIPKDADTSKAPHPDDWVKEANKLFEFKKYLDENPGLSRYELARWCPLGNDYDFRKAISYLKFTGEIYEDAEGFFYVKNKVSLHY